MKIPAIFSNIGKRTVDLVKRTSLQGKEELRQDIVELSSKRGKKDILKLLSLDLESPMGLDKQTIKNLEKMPINDFLNESHKIIINALNIPEGTIIPPLEINNLPKKMLMCYDWSNNTIFINPATLKQSRVNIFSFLRHELQHFNQNLSIIRTENLGENAIKTYSQILAKNNVQEFISTYKDMKQPEIEELIKNGILTENNVSLINQIKKVAATGDSTLEKKLSEKLIKNTFERIYSDWKNVRNTNIEKCGIIKEDSKEGVRAKEYYEGFLRTGGKVGGNEYHNSLHEQEAKFVSTFAWKEYLFKKFWR